MQKNVIRGQETKSINNIIKFDKYSPHEHKKNKGTVKRGAKMKKKKERKKSKKQKRKEKKKKEKKKKRRRGGDFMWTKKPYTTQYSMAPTINVCGAWV